MWWVQHNPYLDEAVSHSQLNCWRPSRASESQSLVLCSVTGHAGLLASSLVLLPCSIKCRNVVFVHLPVISASIWKNFSGKCEISHLPYEKPTQKPCALILRQRFPHPEYEHLCAFQESTVSLTNHKFVFQSRGKRQRAFYVSSWRERQKPHFTVRLQQTDIILLTSFCTVCLAAPPASTALTASTSLSLYHAAFHSNICLEPWAQYQCCFLQQPLLSST